MPCRLRSPSSPADDGNGAAVGGFATGCSCVAAAPGWARLWLAVAAFRSDLPAIERRWEPDGAAALCRARSDARRRPVRRRRAPVCCQAGRGARAAVMARSVLADARRRLVGELTYRGVGCRNQSHAPHMGSNVILCDRPDAAFLIEIFELLYIFLQIVIYVGTSHELMIF